jgi:hypothetical protein
VGALRWMGLGVAVLVALGVLVVLALVAGNPEPGRAEGWEELPALPEPRGEMASTVVERGGASVLVVAGGFSGPTASTARTVHALDPARRAWRRLPDLPEARHHAGAAAIEGDVYVSGGASSVTDRAGRRSLWVLREGASRWAALAPMPEGRESHRMRALDGRLYVVGGREDSGDTLVYDPRRARWERAPALPQRRHHLALAVRDGELWAVGGRTDDDAVLDAVHVWRPGEERWRDGPPLPVPISAAVEGVLDGALHLVGGEDPSVVGGGTVDDHLVLEPGAGRWRGAPPPPVAVHGAGGGVVGERLIVAGGARRQGILSPLAWTDLTAAHPR